MKSTDENERSATTRLMKVKNMMLEQARQKALEHDKLQEAISQ